MKKDMITISSEEEVLSFFEQYSESNPFVGGVNFEGWPNLTFKLTGKKFQGSITPSVMKGFMEMQSQINKAYASFKYGDPEKRLSNEDKAAIEIVVVVDEGSSILNIDLNGFLDTISKVAIEKMTPQDIVITTLGVALVWGGTNVFKKYLETRRETRSEEIKKESEKQHLETLEFMSEQETARLEIIQNIINQKPVIKQQQEYAEESKAELVKSLAKADTVDFAGVEIKQNVMKDLAVNARRKAIDTRIDGVYMVEKVDATDPDVFKVTVRSTHTDEVISCIVQDVFLDEAENKEIIQQGEWDRTPLKLSINAKKIGESITSAVIIKVEKISEKKNQE
ncbi:hypothetical protein [Providencia rustigianii]|uniref:hypothetical protein n=1 Tax=Providencia rustigianii TaxID=158850 RepID=UPI00223FFC8A|nr:hypothetical protein [Providencia rustigianii]